MYMKKAIDLTRRDKLGLSVLYIIFLLSISQLYFNPVSTNELSIYHGTPFSFWVLIFLSFTLITYYVFKRKTRYVALPLLVGKIILLSTPYVRGYLVPTGDVATHYGIIYDIVSTGFTIENWYPLTHIMISELTILTQYPILPFVQYTTIFVSTLSIAFIYLTAKTLIENGENHNLIILFMIVPIVNIYYFTPNNWAWILFSIIIYLVLKDELNLGWIFLLIIFLLAMVITHPLGITIAVAFMIVYRCGRLVLERSERGAPIPSNTLIALAIVSFITYMMHFSLFREQLSRFIKGIIYNTALTSKTFSKLERASGLNLTILDWIRVFILNYYYLLFTLLILGIILIFLIKEKERVFHIIDKRYLIIFAFSIFLLTAWFLSEVNVIPALYFLAGTRFLAPALMLTPISFVLVSQLIKHKQGLLFASILSIILLSMMTTFYNPLRYETNEFIMYSEQVGYMTMENDVYEQYYILIGPPSRHLDISFGTNARSDMVYQVDFMPRYFGYDGNTSIGGWVEEPSYILLTENGKERYVTVFADFDRYIEANYNQINTDKTVDKIYVNGQFTKYLALPV